MMIELKREIVEGKGGKEGKVIDRPPIFGRPAMLGIHLIPTFILEGPERATRGGVNGSQSKFLEET
jgi:hypothetical protein